MKLFEVLIHSRKKNAAETVTVCKEALKDKTVNKKFMVVYLFRKGCNNNRRSTSFWLLFFFFANRIKGNIDCSWRCCFSMNKVSEIWWLQSHSYMRAYSENFQWESGNWFLQHDDLLPWHSLEHSGAFGWKENDGSVPLSQYTVNFFFFKFCSHGLISN